jgi:hypothetical protein
LKKVAAIVGVGGHYLSNKSRTTTGWEEPGLGKRWVFIDHEAYRRLVSHRDGDGRDR